MSLIQKHAGDAKKICDKVHLCSSGLSGKETLLALAHKAGEDGPVLPSKLAADTVGVSYDARVDMNTSMSATLYDSFDQGARRMDFSTFGVRGSKWVQGAKTANPTERTLVNGTCSSGQAYSGPPFVTDRYFWQNATFEGMDYRSVIGPVAKYTQFNGGQFFVGFFREDQTPAEVWVHYNSALRHIDLIGGVEQSFMDGELTPCH
jgi:hypothetical protein